MKYKLFCGAAFVLFSISQISCSSEDAHRHSEEESLSSTHNNPVEKEDSTHDHGPECPSDSAEAHDHESEKDDHEIIFTPEQAKAAGVVIETVKAADFAQVVMVTGSVLPSQGGEATVSATMGGIVHLASDRITEGSKVNAKQTVFQISTQVIGDGNPVAAAKAELQAAEKEWERAKILIVDRIISQREFEDARLRYETALSTSKSMGNGQGLRTVTAPMNGYVQNLLVRNGDFVTMGQPLAVITENRHLRLRAEVPERYYGFLKNISSANFRLAYESEVVYELEQLNGHLLSTGHTVNKGDGFLPVTFEFNNIGNIIPGSLAEIYLLGKNLPNTISIPTAALTEELGLYYVYLQTSDHSYQKQLVKKGANNGSRTEIVEGLHEGDKVVAQGAIAIKLAANAGMVPDPHAGHNH